MTSGKRRVIIFISICLVSLALLTYQKQYKEENLLSYFSKDKIIEPFNWLNNFVFKISSLITDLSHIRAENKRLKQELFNMLIEQQKYSEVISENKRLKELLTLKQYPINIVAFSNVIAKGYDKFLNIVIIDKGEVDGIQKNMAVITTKGLVGKIYKTKEKFSEVLLLNNSNFSVAVRVQHYREEGILSGTGQSFCILKYIQSDKQIPKKSVVITSGLDKIFPQGIFVGYISNIEKKGDFFDYIEVIPFQSLSSIEEVAILKL